ncbi:MAG TPA: TonB-dependent receptor, partial [Novosphingobium sp.]|nr:TonB-dependent receptor [Novosphingobium sp.]
MTAQQLEQHQVAGFDDYAKLLPSVSYQSFGPGQSQLYFRGITNGGDGIASGPLPAAGVYVDETPVTTIFGSVDMHIYDVARVEALAGPQGTLYGASSLSGTLRIITNQPKLGKWEGGLDGEFNKFGPGSAGGKAEGFINIPIGDRAALRISGYYEHDGGYISNVPGTRTYQRQYTSGYDSGDNPIYATDPMNVSNSKYVAKNFNQVDQAGGRAALRVELDDNWTVTPAVYYQHQTAGGTFLYGPEGYSPGNGTPALGDLQVHDFTPDHDRDDWYLASLTIQGKLSDWDVTYSGSYFDRRVDTVADYSYYTVAYDQLYPDYTHFTDANGKAIDPTQVVDTYNKYTKFSQELRISSPAHNPWRLTAGLFMQRQTDRFIANYEIPGLSGSQEGGAVYGDDIFYSNLNRVDRDYAAFAEGSYDITRNVTLTAGIRGFIADNTLFGWSGGAGTLSKVAATNNCTGNVTVFSCPDVNSKYVGSGETHKASLKWQVNHNAMVYFTYSTGFRPGGNN